jgi:predicted RNase H-like HicB family nuclease
MIKREFDILIEQDEAGYYIASVPELPGCHTQAKSLDELHERIIEAIELYLETDKEKLGKSNMFVGIQKVESSLQKGIILETNELRKDY